MKLAYCPICFDIFKLIKDVRSCSCGMSSGLIKTRNGFRVAQINGPVKLIGIKDPSFFEAVHNQPYKGPGKEFVAFVMPKVHKAVYKIKAVHQFTIGSTVPKKDIGVSPYSHVKQVYDDYVGKTEGSTEMSGKHECRLCGTEMDYAGDCYVCQECGERVEISQQ